MVGSNILIFGSKGWIGKKVVTLLEKNPNVSVYCAKSRADNIEEIKKELKLHIL